MEGALFAIEKLQHQHPRNRFLQVRIDARDGSANTPVGIAHRVAKDSSRVHDDRKRGEGDQRQLPVRVHHDADNAGQHEHIFKNRNHARRKHFIERVDIGSHARHQSAHRVLIEKRDVHVLQMTKNLLAQIEHHFLTGPLHQVSLNKLQRESQTKNPDVESANLRNASQRSAAQPVANPGMGRRVGVGRLRQILVDGDHGKKRTQYI